MNALDDEDDAFESNDYKNRSLRAFCLIYKRLDTNEQQPTVIASIFR